MPADTICKIVHQYSKGPVSGEDMAKLQEIARGYGAVKNYVYQRYGGVGSLPKLYPGYTVQNEMTKSGLRESLGLPSVYFYMAVFDALGEIKAQWTRTKTMILGNVNQNQNLSEDEKHFLRFLLKVNNGFESAVIGSPLKLPKDINRRYDQLASLVDVRRMENYLARQTRKCHKKLHTQGVMGFSMTGKAYGYGDHGIYIAVKEKRKRIFVPLTDGNSYTRQIYVSLFPEESRIELKVPVDIAVKKHRDYTKIVGISMGMMTMVVTDQGHRYGEELGIYQSRLSDWVREQQAVYGKNKEANPGRKKYYAGKRRLEEQLHSYINRELNRFLKEEKPQIIYLPRLPHRAGEGKVKKMNHYAAMWQRGYIKDRLAQKCREQAIELAEVPGKDISSECGRCGALGEKEGQLFRCPSCGYQIDRKENSARNARRRGLKTEEKSEL